MSLKSKIPQIKNPDTASSTDQDVRKLRHGMRHIVNLAGRGGKNRCVGIEACMASENTAGYDSAKRQKYISIKGDGKRNNDETATASIPQKELVTKVRTAMTTK